jgi:hypothetical protein
MAVVHAVVLLVTLIALLLLPCGMAVLIFADEVSAWLSWTVTRRWRERRERRALSRLDRALEGALAGQRDALDALACADRPSIEQVAADLRRLGRLRRSVATTSPVWHSAVLGAYDDRLRLACRYLDVPEHLERLGGMDLEIERVRVEGALAANGLVLTGTRRGQDA